MEIFKYVKKKHLYFLIVLIIMAIASFFVNSDQDDQVNKNTDPAVYSTEDTGKTKSDQNEKVQESPDYPVALFLVANNNGDPSIAKDVFTGKMLTLYNSSIEQNEQQVFTKFFDDIKGFTLNDFLKEETDNGFIYKHIIEEQDLNGYFAFVVTKEGDRWVLDFDYEVSMPAQR